MVTALSPSPSQLCAAAEQALLLSDFSDAEAHARRCLAKSGSVAASVQERALVVALQALCEQDRASAAQRLLTDCYPRLEDAPPNVVLVWLALAVDSQHGAEAKQAVPALLSSCQPGGAAGWNGQQYLALLHLYVFEVLLRERQNCAEVARWVQTAELPIAADERRLLLDELAAGQAGQQPSRFAAPPLDSQSASVAAAGKAAHGAASVAAANAATVRQADSGRHARQVPPGQTLAADQPEAVAAQKPKQQRQWQREPEIVPAPQLQSAADSSGNSSGSSGSGSEAPSAVQAGVEWLWQAQQQVVQAAAAFVQPLLGRPPAGKQGSRSALAASHPSPDPTQLLGGTVLGAVLLYALYAERQSIRRGARRARQAVVTGTRQLLRMAFSLSVNPVATSSPAWR